MERRAEIRIEGSTFGDQVAIGNAGPVTQTGGPAHPAQAAADALVRLVSEHLEELDPATAAKVRRDALEVQAELREPDPDQSRIRAALGRVGQRAATVLPVAGAAAEILSLFAGQAAVQSRSLSRGQVFTTRSASIPHLAARSHP
ncbi:hypothetical protein [Nonomuraea sp. NPDC050643]|uniref:hypothetical protein n=1 Tax=Nonomuraea sp. NPDC050643 TaxID=3155660 RepID=UPI0033CB9BF9